MNRPNFTIANSRHYDFEMGSSSLDPVKSDSCNMPVRRSGLHVSFAPPEVITNTITVPRYHPDDISKLFYIPKEWEMFRWEATSKYSWDLSIDGLTEDIVEVARCAGLVSRSEASRGADNCGEGINVPKLLISGAVSASIMVFIYSAGLWLFGADAIYSLIDLILL